MTKKSITPRHHGKSDTQEIQKNFSKQHQDQINRKAHRIDKAISDQLLIFVRGLLKKPTLRPQDVEFCIKKSPYEIGIRVQKIPVEGKISYQVIATRDNIIVDNQTFSIFQGTI